MSALKLSVVCMANEGYEASEKRRRRYEANGDAAAENLGQLRVIDESGEDHLSATEIFAPSNYRSC